MDARFLNYYNRELNFIRENSAEFAREFPKVAGRLGLDGTDCSDPYVERLLEGFAFLTARVQQKIDAEFPKFTQHLLEVVFPHYLAPTPSMVMAQIQPDLAEGDLLDGFTVPAGSPLRGRVVEGMRTNCEFRTAHKVELWPLRIAAASYLGSPAEISAKGIERATGAVAAISLQLELTVEANFSQTSLSTLPLYVGNAPFADKLYEQLLARTTNIATRFDRKGRSVTTNFRDVKIEEVGFEEDEALLPVVSRAFQGYRLLLEYFCFSKRFMSVRLCGLESVLSYCDAKSIELVLQFNQPAPDLEDSITENSFQLFCTPAANIFERRADRIHIEPGSHLHHVVPDRTRPLDYEVYAVTDVTGLSDATLPEQVFKPLYAGRSKQKAMGDERYFAVERRARLVSSQQLRNGARSSYAGTDLFVSLVDEAEAPIHNQLRQLSVNATCTNRDLPLFMPVGKSKDTDFDWDVGGPIEAIWCIAGPSAPKMPLAQGRQAWSLINHLTLNYLSLIDNDGEEGASALRALLRLYVEAADPAVSAQIDGVASIVSSSVIQRVPAGRRIAYGRGLNIDLMCHEANFEGIGVFLFGSIVDKFFAKYVSINSFTQTTLSTFERGEIYRWPVILGRRQIA